MKGFAWYDLIHGYIYGRWPYLYISMGQRQHPLARFLAPLVGWIIARLPSPNLPSSTPMDVHPSAWRFANTYHGKVVTLETARHLVTIREEIRVTVPESVIPFPKAREIILQNPDHIAVIDCPCRSARPNPCLPLDVCLIVGEPFASFVVEHHPARSRRIEASEALEILKAEDDRGHVHHAFFKDAMLGRFYAICNCCTCCCGAMHAQRSGTPMLIASGYSAAIDAANCRGCGACARICPFEAVHIDNHLAIVDPGRCMGCGVCVSHCTRQAITLQPAENGLEPLSVSLFSDKF